MDIERRVNDERRVSEDDIIGTVMIEPPRWKRLLGFTTFTFLRIFQLSWSKIDGDNGLGAYKEDHRKTARREQEELLYDVAVESGAPMPPSSKDPESFFIDPPIVEDVEESIPEYPAETPFIDIDLAPDIAVPVPAAPTVPAPPETS